MSRSVVLLGPQVPRPNLARAVEMLGVDSPLAVVTAGWQERSGETNALARHLDRKLINLQLYERAERVFREDPELFEAHRRRQDRLRKLQGLYRLRLSPLLATARELLQQNTEEDLIEAEQEAALEMVRLLDSHHLSRLKAIHQQWQAEWRPAERSALVAQGEGLAELLGQCGALLIAGGHVAVLLNRLRLFGLDSLVGSKPVIAWSAGAMAISERVVLFHDSPPQGAGDPEVLESGLGLVPGVIPLPHARRRLRLDDRCRVELFARRFLPDLSMTLDGGSMIWLENGHWLGSNKARRLTAQGRLAGVEENVAGH